MEKYVKTRNSIKKVGMFSSLFEELPALAGFLFALLASRRATGNALPGGVLYLAAQAMLLCAAARARMAKGKERAHFLWAALSALPALGAMLVHSLLSKLPGMWLLVLFVGLMLPGTLPGAKFGKSGLHRFFIVAACGAIACTVFFLLLESRLFIFALLYHLPAVVMALLSVGTKEQGREEEAVQPVEDIRRVYAYRLFWNMNLGIGAALQTSVLLGIFHLVYVQSLRFGDLILQIAVLIALYYFATAVSRMLLNRFKKRAMGNNAVFLFFTLLWLALNVYAYRQPLQGTIGWHVYYALFCLCIVSLASAIWNMDEDMQALCKITADFTAAQYLNYKVRISRWVRVSAHLAVLYIAAALLLFAPLPANNVLPMMPYAFVVLPSLFLLGALVASVRQPLTAYYEQKLAKTRRLQNEGVRNPTLEERLKKGLFYKRSKQIGLGIVKFLLRPFMRHRLVGLANVQEYDFPAVFVCNHAEIYGPVAAILNMPYHVRPWIHDRMVDRGQVGTHMQGTFDRWRWLPAPLRKKMGVWLSGAVAWAMNATDPIPVYRSNLRKLLKSLSLSVDALLAEDNLLIFPENPGDAYVTEGVGQFFTGFVDIARQYYRKTGRRLVFYAVFANKKNRTFSFAERVVFNPEADFSTEKQRVADALRENMRGFYENPLV